MQFLVLASLVLAACAAPSKRTVAAIEADLNTISTQVTALNNAVTAFPNTGGNLLQALVHLMLSLLEIYIFISLF